MPVTADEDRTVYFKAGDLADYLGVSGAYLSKATHKDYLAGGFRVSQWAVWHWKGNRVDGYEVPEQVARQIVPSSEKPKYDL